MTSIQCLQSSEKVMDDQKCFHFFLYINCGQKKRLKINKTGIFCFRFINYTLERNLTKVALYNEETPYENFITHWRETLRKLLKPYLSCITHWREALPKLLKPYLSCITHWRETLPKLHYTPERNLPKATLHTGEKPYLSC